MNEEKSFTKEELSKFNGQNGNPSYVAVRGVVYDVSAVPAWSDDTHFGLSPGNDLTENFESCHVVDTNLRKLPIVGKLVQTE